MAAQAGIDIGDVTVNNANANPVPVSDGGGSLTVDGSVSAAVTGSVSVTNAAGGAAVNVQDGGNSLTVDGAVTVSNTTAPPVHCQTQLVGEVDDGINRVGVDLFGRLKVGAPWTAADLIHRYEDESRLSYGSGEVGGTRGS